MNRSKDVYHSVWYDEWDIILLDLLKKKAKYIRMDRTILATGVVAVVAVKYSNRLGLDFTPLECVKRIIHLKRRYEEFRQFLAIEGISYSVDTNTITAGDAYLNAVNLETENPKHTTFRCFGERLYPAMSSIFKDTGLPAIDLDWIYKYFDSEPDTPGLRLPAFP